MLWLSRSHLWCGRWCSLVIMQMVWVSWKKGMGKSLRNQKAPRRSPGPLSMQGNSWGDEYHPHEQSARVGCFFLIFAAVVKVKRPREQESLWHWRMLKFKGTVKSFLYSFSLLKKKNPSAFVKATSQSIINQQCRDLSCSSVFSRFDTCPVYLADTRKVGFN